MKNIILYAFTLSFLFAGCVSTRTLVDYQEKNKNRKSVVEKHYAAEKTKRPNPKYVLPALKNVKPVGYIIMLPITVATDVVSTVFISPFTKTETIGYGKIIVSGQLIDENNIPIKNYQFDIEGHKVISDDNGFFSKQIDSKGSYSTNIIITFLDLSKITNDFNNGEKVVIISPYKIKYSVKSNKEIEVEENIIEVKQASKHGDRDSIVVTSTIVDNLKSNKIMLNTKELFSEKNKQITIEEENRKKEDAMAEERRKREDAIAEEKRIELKQKTAKSIQDKLQKGKDVSIYNAKDIADVIEQISVSYEDAVYFLAGSGSMEIGQFISVCPFEILQILPGEGLLMKVGDRGGLFYVQFKNTNKFRDGQILYIRGQYKGNHSYTTIYGVRKTIPKIKAYVIMDWVQWQREDKELWIK